ncbi:MAG: nucleoside kinase [Pseudomonadota bacterium]
MSGIIIHINGWPGVGKYTIGKNVAAQLNARFVPNHSICAPANCVADFGTPTFFEMARQVRALVFEQMIKAPSHERFVLTSVLDDGADDTARFEAIQTRAKGRSQPLLAVTLVCDADENLRRLDTPLRAARHSLTDSEILRSLFKDYRLLQPHHEFELELDTTNKKPKENAQAIVRRARQLAS